MKISLKYVGNFPSFHAKSKWPQHIEKMMFQFKLTPGGYGCDKQCGSVTINRTALWKCVTD